MKYYQMSNKVLLKDLDGRERACLYKRSHRYLQMNTGDFLVDYTSNDSGEAFKGPLICELDDEDSTGVFPTFFMSPSLIGTRQFYRDLVEIGIDNIEMHPVIIKDEENGKTIEDYLLLNIIGRVSCAVMDQSDTERLNDAAAEGDPCDSMNFINELVIDAARVGSRDLFLLHEDTSYILVSERVFQHLIKKGYTDIFFEEIRQL
ncbi:MAG TPA: DUF1629 domain-containing protein [Cellvibrio sp.]|nr:DUF1629 domain-containing protein [Cellvibrio sp.]